MAESTFDEATLATMPHVLRLLLLRQLCRILLHRQLDLSF